MMNWSADKKWIFGGFGVTLFLFAILNFISYQNTKNLRTSATKVGETYEVLNNLINFYANMAVAESGRRGYIASGSLQELERHRTALVYIQSDLNNLKSMLDRGEEERARLAKLQKLVAERITLFKTSIELYQKNKKAEIEQANLTGRSIILREEILTIVNEIKVEQENWLQVWTFQSRHSLSYRLTIEILGTFLSFCVLLVVVTVLYRHQLQRQKLEEIEQKLAREKELSELKINLFSTISHEFRTPLTTILASSQLFKESLTQTLDSRQIRNIDRIQSSVKLMNKLIDDILTLTRAEAGKLEYNPTLINIDSFCLNLLEDLQFFVTPKHQLNLVDLSSYPKAYLDEKLSYSILSNGIINAIKYSPEGGTIELVVNCTKEQVIFQVKDRGIGIDPEDIDRLYEPFYRGKNINNIVGNGLGLAVVKKCLELQKGTISIKKNRDQGTTFTITIPQA
jgi:signal transduction histidine kinase